MRKIIPCAVFNLFICMTLAGCNMILFTGTAARDPVIQVLSLPTYPIPTSTPTKTPDPTPTSVADPAPTPTPDPMDQYFADPGEEVIMQDFTSWNYWVYISHDINIQVRKVNIAERHLVYYVTEIRMRNGVKERPGLANTRFPQTGTKKPYLIAREYMAVFAQNGDFLTREEKELKGILIRYGNLYSDGRGEDTLAFLPGGELRIYSPGETTGEALLAMGVDTTYSFGPTLVRDGKINPNIHRHRISGGRNPRSAIGMIEPGHYISIVAEGGQMNGTAGMTCMELAEKFLEYGCTVAYNLDGGASTSIIFMGNSLITHDHYYYGQRTLPDMLMFGYSGSVPSPKEPTEYTGDGKNLPAKPPEQITAAPSAAASPEPATT